MTESATINRRERRMRQTAADLTSVTRRLTAERGLAGFTIEEVCDEVDVSRRTFFNYFPSKEDAVIGASPGEEEEAFEAAFLALGPGEWADILDEIVAIAIAHFNADAHAADHAQFMLCLEREPRLLARFIGVTRERERQITELIAGRQGVESDDPRASAVVSILSTLLKTSSDTFLEPRNSADFATILTSSLATMREVLVSPQPRKVHP